LSDWRTGRSKGCAKSSGSFYIETRWMRLLFIKVVVGIPFVSFVTIVAVVVMVVDDDRCSKVAQ
jgi:hypothetical protein